MRLNVFERGTGPALLFVHGFPLDHTMWRAQLDHFAADFHVIAPDLRGFGASSPGPDVGSVSMEQFADDCARLLDALGVQTEVTFCGLSMGGYVAWQFARKYPQRLARLVLCDTRAAADTPAAAETRFKMAEHVLAAGTEIVARAMLPKMFAPATLARTAGNRGGGGARDPANATGGDCRSPARDGGSARCLRLVAAISRGPRW